MLKNLLQKSILFSRQEVAEYQKIKLLMNKNLKFLCNGTYKTLTTGKRISYIADKKNMKFINQSFKQLNKNKKTISSSIVIRVKIILSTFIFIRIGTVLESSFKGSIIMLLYGNGVKIFDLENKKVLTNYDFNFVTYQKIKNAHDYFMKYFKTTIIEFCDENLIFIERYLDFIPSVEWSSQDKENCFISLINSYLNYIKNFNKGKITTESPQELLRKIITTKKSFEKTELFQLLKKIIIQCTYEFERILIHGDLKMDNILLYKDEFYLIDFELSRECIFFHDILNFLVFDALNIQDMSYLNNFLNGEYDIYFKKIFEAFGNDYKENNKIIYLTTYVLEKITYFEDLEILAESLHYEKYLNLMKYISEYYKIA